MAHIGPILAHIGPLLTPSWPHFGTIFTHVGLILTSFWPRHGQPRQFMYGLGSILAHLGPILGSCWLPSWAQLGSSWLCGLNHVFVGSVYQFFELKAGPGTNQDHVSPIAAKPNPVVPTNLHQPLHTFLKNSGGLQVSFGVPISCAFPVGAGF